MGSYWKPAADADILNQWSVFLRNLEIQTEVRIHFTKLLKNYKLKLFTIITPVAYDKPTSFLFQLLINLTITA